MQEQGTNSVGEQSAEYEQYEEVRSDLENVPKLNCMWDFPQ